jgi:predicted alpha/beta superfamily hydrolase
LKSVLALLALGAPVAAQDRRGEVVLPNTETHVLHSEAVDQEYRLLIARPFAPPRPGTRTSPVVYVLDADVSFPLARQVAFSLESGFEIPPLLIVGVAYAGGVREGMLRRNRDYTPTRDDLFMRHAARWGAAVGGDASGGAGAFLEFVREELKPYVEEHLPADPTDATIFGVSFGGLFATYALLEAPDTFQRYVIGSPSLWWDDRVLFEHERRYAEEHDDLAARVFIGAGSHETAEHDAEQLARLPASIREPMLAFQEAMDGRVRMVEVIEPFVERLRGRGYPGLDLTLYLFPEETHASAPPMTLSRGLRIVFGTP